MGEKILTILRNLWKKSFRLSLRSRKTKKLIIRKDGKN